MGNPEPEPPVPLWKNLTPTKVYDALWALPVLYSSETNPFIQKIAITGRYQGQIWGLNSNFGSASGWENRRQRIGARVDFLQDFRAHVTFNLNFDGANTGRFLEDFEDFGIEWTPAREFNVEVGLFKVPITHEWRESSNVIVTIERSDFINMAVPPKLGGVLVTGEIDGFTDGSAFTYGAGIYSAARGEDWQAPSFNGGTIFYQGIGYQFSESQSVRFDGGALTSESENNAAAPYPYVASVSYTGNFLNEKLSLLGEVVFAAGGTETAGLYGLILLPTYRLTEQIELVARYQYLGSDESDGVRLQRRYERRAPDLPTTWGNHYQALYGGVNYYLYKNRMKVMCGLEYSHMELARGGAYNQVTIFGAFRVWF